RIRLLQRKGRGIEFSRLSDLRPYRIAVVRDYAYAPEFDRDGRLQKVNVTSFANAARMLEAGRVDLAVEDELALGVAFKGELADLRDKLEVLPIPLGENGLHLLVSLRNPRHDEIVDGFDLAIRLGRLSDSRLVATRLAPRVMYLCATPEYLRRHGTPQSPAELGQFNCLIGSSDLWSFLEDGRETQHRVQGNWRCNSGQAVLDAALRGFGLCQLPDYYVIEHLRSGRLVSLLEGHQPPNTAVWALYPQQRHLSPKVRQLVDYLKEGLAQSHPGLAGEKNLR
ncbi:LysR substrate-binding domain-containing protein, partial [Acinetobacter baumannii]